MISRLIAAAIETNAIDAKAMTEHSLLTALHAFQLPKLDIIAINPLLCKIDGGTLIGTF
jgi:hypothetical protein